MIDWWDVSVNAVWIGGLAIFLAAISYRSAAKTHAKGTAPVFDRWMWSGEIWPAVGLALFCLGLGLSSDQTWQRVVWLALFLLSLAQPFLSVWLERRKGGEKPRKE